MLVASASFPVGLLRPAVPRRRATRITACEPSLGRAGRHLEACGDALVAAAAVLGENQFQEEEPGSWSAAGCALAISGRDFAEATAALADSNWEAATGPLASAAAQFCIAAASTASHADASAAFEEAAAAVEDASSCTGCISLAAAAGPSLAEGGAALQARRNSLASTATGWQTSTERARAASPARASSEERASSLLPENSSCSRDRGSRAAKSTCASKNSYATLSPPLVGTSASSSLSS